MALRLAHGEDVDAVPLRIIHAGSYGRAAAGGVGLALRSEVGAEMDQGGGRENDGAVVVFWDLVAARRYVFDNFRCIFVFEKETLNRGSGREKGLTGGTAHWRGDGTAEREHYLLHGARGALRGQQGLAPFSSHIVQIIDLELAE